MKNKQPTIAAIATPPGEGGISIVRISGPEAIAIANTVFSGDVSAFTSHTVHYGVVQGSKGERLDEALLVIMRAPRSYTGEDVIELQCHGGRIASRKVLEAIFDAGATPAEPGAFTFRAYMNGKMDLTQAEAVQKLIGAKSELAYKAASKHLEGGLFKKISSFQKELFRLAAIFEAWVDFPEEGIEFQSEEEVLADLNRLREGIERLVVTFHEGKQVETGVSLCLVGPPNAGKSSLMNALLDYDRAIVTPIPGTTRDLLQEELTLGGQRFRLIDTAGLRETEEEIEQEGIVRSKRAMREADVVLLVLDVTCDQIPFQIEKNTIVIWNKCDLLKTHKQALAPYEVSLSAKRGVGLEQLKEAIDRLIWKEGVPPKDEVMITTLRHKEGLSQAADALAALIKGLQKGVSPEFLNADLREALRGLDRVIGTDITEEVLSSIFSQFCVGK